MKPKEKRFWLIFIGFLIWLLWPRKKGIASTTLRYDLENLPEQSTGYFSQSEINQMAGSPSSTYLGSVYQSSESLLAPYIAPGADPGGAGCCCG